MKLRGCLFSIVAIIAAFSGDPAAGAEPRTREQTVVDFVDAFSRHDLPALISMTHPEVEWLTVGGSSISVDARGQQALSASLRSYFESCQTCRSTVSVSGVNGNFVSALETASWQSGGTRRSQASLSVYELVDGKVRRVWYFPAVKQ